MNKIKILGAPFNFGQPHSGVSHSYDILKKLGLIELLNAVAPVMDLGSLTFPKLTSQRTSSKIKNAQMCSVANMIVAEYIETLNLTESFLLNIGGDHGVALGTIHGILTHRPDTIVVWADAHGDINPPESSLTGNFHGMPLAFLLGIAKDKDLFPWIRNKLSANKLIFMGPRDLDPQEKAIIKDLSIQYYSSEDIKASGSRELLARALKKADPDNRCSIHLSFDVDVFDEKAIMATGTRVTQGPAVTEIFQLGEFLAKTGRLRSMDLVELNADLASEAQMLQSFYLAMEFVSYTLMNSQLQNNNSVRAFDNGAA